ncbi:hypothetical protein [Methylocapsa acidiphila]|uniref:hypothetical protein n=1 Tax=Methylocapsa acidiphila TaxID=133552 RepID=UPI0004291548|nr:hypothetical protein [Methylocapsa acidiphila]
MDKKIVGMIGAISAVASGSAAQASTENVAKLMNPGSYAELLEPIPNAAALLRAADAAAARGAFTNKTASGNANVRAAQYYPAYPDYPYYHHHHHHYYPPYDYYYHHHHHHHHHHYYEENDGQPE